MERKVGAADVAQWDPPRVDVNDVGFWRGHCFVKHNGEFALADLFLMTCAVCVLNLNLFMNTYLSR